MKDLAKELSRLQESDRILARIRSLLEGPSAKRGGKRKPLSKAARKKIAAAQRRRWAKVKAKKAS